MTTRPEIDDSRLSAIHEVARWARSAQSSVGSLAATGLSPEQLGAAAALGRLVVRGRNASEPTMQNWGLTSAEPAPPDEISKTFETLLGADAASSLGKLYELVVAKPNRRALGTFFTPAPVVERMVKLSASDRWSRIVDPGAGVGAFTTPALQASPRAEMHAVDVNIVTLGLLAASVRAFPSIANRCRYFNQSFFAYLVAEGASSGPTLYLGNPPYTRYSDLSPSARNEARELTAELAPSGQPSLAGSFLASILQMARPEDGLCLLLPAAWTQSRYASKIREWLWNCSREVRLERFPPAYQVFPDADVDAVILYVSPVRSDGRFVLSESTVDSHGRLVVTRERAVDRDASIPTTFEQLWATTHSRTKGTKLDGTCLIRRGAATGMNGYFFLNQAKVDEFDLEPHALTPAISRASDFAVDNTGPAEFERARSQGGRVWLFTPEGDVANPSNARYLEHGVLVGADDRVLSGRRASWWDVERPPVADILISTIGRGSFRVIRNDGGVVHSNNFVGLKVKPNSRWTADLLAEWLRSAEGQRGLLSASVQFSSEARRLQFSALRSLDLPDRVAQ